MGGIALEGGMREDGFDRGSEVSVCLEEVFEERERFGGEPAFKNNRFLLKLGADVAEVGGREGWFPW